MAKGAYELVYNEYGNTVAIEVGLRGIEVGGHNFIDKSSAFSAEERDSFKLNAMLPPAIRTMSQQLQNNAKICSAKSNDVEKFIYIRSLYDRNATLAHALIASDIEQYMGCYIL